MRPSACRTAAAIGLLVCALGFAPAALGQQIVINEVHYNPPGDDATVLLEYIELYNRGGASVDLTGWRLRFGPEDFVFPAGTSLSSGAYVVVAERIPNLALATGYTAAFEWFGLNTGLGNGGDTVQLFTSALVMVDAVTFDDDPPWPTAPDGNGPSLERVNPAAPGSSAASWRASLVTHGTPGAQNSTFSVSPVVSGETPRRLSAVETLSQVAVTFSTAVSGVVAANLTVGGSPATSVSCPTCSGGVGAGPYYFTGFAAPTPGSVTIAVASGSIQSSPGGVPFGGESWTVSVGIVVAINEIHYHPVSNPDAEFVEFHNAGATTADLTGWTISDGLDLTFPPGTTLLPGGYLVIAFSPAILQSVTGYSGAIAWGAGRLANEGERLALADASGNEIDVVRFDDRGSWPAAPDGSGPSLELINPRLPNEFGAAWMASLATHGTPGAQNGRYQASVAPIVAEPAHAPVIPAASQSVTITALVIDDTNPSPTVTLYHRLDQDPTLAYTAVPMFDDGAHGDGVAGDRVYGASVPGQANDTRMDFTIRASDGVNVGAPEGHDNLNAGQYPTKTYLVEFSNTPPPTDFPSYRLLTTQRVRNAQGAVHDQTYYDATFVHCGVGGACTVYYNIWERYRGQSSLNAHPHSFRIDFLDEKPLDSELGFPVTRVLLMSQGIPKQHMGYRFFREAFDGRILGSHTQFIRMHQSPLSEGNATQDLVYVNVERQDEDFLTSQGGDVAPTRFPSLCSVAATPCGSDAECPPGETCFDRTHGNLYQGQHPNANLQYLGPSPENGYRTATYQKETNEEEDNWSDLIDLCSALDPDTTSDANFEAAVKARVDEDQWAKWFGANLLLVNQEGGIYRDTGDDYYVYFEPPGGPLGPNAVMIPRDQDSVFGGFAGTFNQDSIWRTNVQTTQRFLRSNAFAGRFVGAICELLATTFTSANLDPWVDAMPSQVADASFKQSLKNWIAARIPYVNAEITRQTTLTGVPASPYTNANPVINLSGQLNQCGTRRVLLNGQPLADAAFSVYGHTWLSPFTLSPGPNQIVVQSVDDAGNVLDSATASVVYAPPGVAQSSLRLTMPSRMLNEYTLSLRAEVLDSLSRIDWRTCDQVGSVSATRVSNGASVPISVTVFDNHVSVPADSIRFYNGQGSVSFTLDNGAAEPAGDIRVTVTLGSLTASKIVTVVSAPTYRTMSGTLTGANLTWGPNETIRVTGSSTVPSGSVLTINPGTLVLVNTTGGLGDGTVINVNGSVSAVGTRDNPIHFFSERNQLAMTLTQSGSASNANAWRGVFHFGGATSTYKWVFLSGAGNGVVTGHPRPPILSLNNTHNLLVEDSTFVDNNGMIFSAPGTGSYTVRRSMISRCGIGAEFNGNGHTLLIEDTWWTSCGWAPEPENLDGDLMHVDGSASNQTIRSSIFADGGDDGIDHSGSNFRVENIIIRRILDKAISMTGGSVEMHNSLIFDTGTAIRGLGRVYNTTIASGNVLTPQILQESILWTGSNDSCSGDIDYNILGNPAHTTCGVGNISVNPQFQGSCNFNPQAGSPALTAGPTGGRIGWLGFPSADTCLVDAECNDNNPCSIDTCQLGVCTFTPIVGCTPCAINADCEDGDQCTQNTCGAQGTCLAATPVSCDDGNACTADSCSTLLGCQHTSASCDDGNLCTDDSCNPTSGCQHANNSAPCSDGNLCTSGDICGAGICLGTAVSCPSGYTCQPATGICVAGPTTISFQEGVGGFAGTQDTYVDQTASEAGIGHGSLDNWRWDTENPAPEPEFGLIRFDGIFGSGPGQIPPGSAISSATLRLVVFNAGVSPAGSINESAVVWDEATATWNNFGGDAGVQADEYRAAPQYAAPFATGAVTVNVTASLQSWSANSALNLGWVFRPNSNDGIQVRSAEYATIADRPQLTVQYVPPTTGCTTNPQCDDNDVCNGSETCVGGVCEPGIPLDCGDGNVCTTDTCNPSTGCEHANNTGPCDDGNACTTGDACAAGACVPGPAANCDDGNVCTDDACVPASGCSHANNSAPCSDGSLCTSGDVCGGGTCSGTPVVCPGGQVCNPGSGVCVPATDPPLPIAIGAVWKYFKGTAEPSPPPSPPTWAGIGFSDTSWLEGPSGFGYGPDCAASRGTTLGDMQNGYLSLYLRRKFHVDNPAAVTSLTLTVDYDDAWIAYLNGQEVARSASMGGTAGVPTAYNAIAASGHECSVCDGPPCNPAEAFGLSTAPLVSGTNVIALHVHNQSLASSDFTLAPTLTATIAACSTPADCDDGAFCNGAETCVTGACQPGTPPSCDDGVACTVDSCNEATDSCDHAPCSMTVAASGSRYLAVTPPAGVSSVALRVSAAGLACLPQFVDATGRLVAAPVYRSPAAWGTVQVGDREILPATPYTVTALAPGAVPIGSGAATTWVWGNANNADDVNVFDIVCVLDGFGGIFTQCTLQGDDLKSGEPDRTIDLDDILAVLDAFGGLSYPDGNPCAALAPEPGGGKAAGFAGGNLLRLVPWRTTLRPGETLRVDVYGSSLVDLRGYQVALAVSGGAVGTLEPVAAEVDVDRADYAFRGLGSFPASDGPGARLASALEQGGASPDGEVYLGSFTFRPSGGARGTFEVSFRPDEVLLRDSAGGALAPQLGAAVQIRIAEGGGRRSRRTQVFERSTQENP